ncbi:hypothetical protein PPL_07284 [Heterostelium album PN500]|uniref:Vesicle transport v-SNARE N-terminal domain-containing protein n=1 Tax=Heterostelium pallidum (strain ATCC 26659 / Pp 5 / PN500) TaxID=670386 RepID=D3BEW8_HETP5|nr:hypothetical protein PPL_07284 [Heterostelium album PN500]EFA80449.1 hypothetical protein PPL_07284 [Heterostelium album PN500]|eukprot:XP_020432569.1 hypothetical protein PPL_07284 [Heterostelium album PN500]
MDHVFTHYEQDFNELADSIHCNLNSLSNHSVSNDEKIILINKIECDLEEAQEIVQQLEFSAQNSGTITTARPKIVAFNNIIRERTKELESITGVQVKGGVEKKKIRFDEANIIVREDVDNYVEEEDLGDLRAKEELYLGMDRKGCIPFIKRNALKITVITILSLTIAFIVIFVYTRKNSKNPEKPVH